MSANGIWNSIHALKKSVYDPSIKLNKQFDTEAQKKSQVDYYVLRKLYFCTIIVFRLDDLLSNIDRTFLHVPGVAHTTVARLQTWWHVTMKDTVLQTVTCEAPLLVPDCSPITPSLPFLICSSEKFLSFFVENLGWWCQRNFTVVFTIYG